MKYYAMIDGERKGPFQLEELPGAGVRPSTYIWCKGMPDWQKAEENPDVCRLFRNHLYDRMHPMGELPGVSASELEKYRIKEDEPPAQYPSRFDGILNKAGEDGLPTLEEIDAREDKSVPPLNMVPYAWLVTFLCFLPTGIVALIFAYKSRTQWKAGNKDMAHDYARSAKMWVGITFFLGMIFWAFFFAFNL